MSLTSKLPKICELTKVVRNTNVVSLISQEARDIIGDRMQNYRIGYIKYPLEIPIDPKPDQCCQNYCHDCVFTLHGKQITRFSQFVTEHARHIDMNREGNLVVSCQNLYEKFRKYVYAS